MAVIAVNREYTYPITVKLVVWECPSCGIVYGIPRHFVDELRSNGGHYYCPNGHHLSWDETDADRERKKREAAERRAEQAEQAARYQRERAEREERSARAFKGHLTRIRKRISEGVCPVPGCRRSGFVKVRAHIASKHPGWLAEHVHEIDSA